MNLSISKIRNYIFDFLKTNIFENFYKFALGNLILLIVSYIVNYQLNIYLSKKNLGEFYYIIAIYNLLVPLFSLSIYSLFIRFANEIEKERLVPFVFTNVVISFLFLNFFIFYLFENLYINFYTFIIFFNAVCYFHRGYLEIQMYNILTNFQKLLYLFLISLSFYYKSDLNAYYVIFILGLTFLIISFFGFIYSKFKNRINILDFKIINNSNNLLLYKFAIYAMITDLINQLLISIDQIMLKEFLGVVDLAPYAVAYRTISLIGVISSFFILIYPSLYFKALREKSFEQIKLFRNMFLVVLVTLSSLIYYYSSEIYLFTGADKYLLDLALFEILIVSDIFRLSAAIFLSYNVYMNKQKINVQILLLIVVLNVLLNSFFIPIYGAYAAAYSTLFCYFTYFAFSIFSGYFPEKKFIQTIKG